MIKCIHISLGTIIGYTGTTGGDDETMEAAAAAQTGVDTIIMMLLQGHEHASAS